MSFKVTTKELKRVSLVEVAGRVDSSTAPQLEQALQSLIDTGHYNIIVNLSETEYMSSAAPPSKINPRPAIRRPSTPRDFLIWR